MPNFPKRLAQKIERRVAENALRELSARPKLIDFSSNDYLGFSRDYGLAKKTLGFLKEDRVFGNGSTGSRLLTGNHPLYEKLELEVAIYHKAESALVFNSGYDANLGFFSSVPQRNDIVLYDELCHASIRDGIKLGHAKSYKFKHNDVTDLKKIVSLLVASKTMGTEIYLVTESVFSMDGDIPDLQGISQVCSKNDVRLVIDEAHAVGVFERGLVNQLQLENTVFARIITFGKALGCHGAAILGSNKLRTYLLNFARSLIYTTSLSPHSVANVLAAYDELKSVHGVDSRQQLRSNIDYFLDEIHKNGLSAYFRASNSAIQICQVGGNIKVKAISDKLLKEGFDVRPILAPTVSKGEERLRLCIHSFNTKDDIKKVLLIIKNSLQ